MIFLLPILNLRHRDLLHQEDSPLNSIIKVSNYKKLSSNSNNISDWLLKFTSLKVIMLLYADSFLFTFFHLGTHLIMNSVVNLVKAKIIFIIYFIQIDWQDHIYFDVLFQ